jgi:urocanate hydratase
VQDIMGDVFSLGFGPFRWVCTSGRPEDLATTDAIAAEVFERLMPNSSPSALQQYNDNYKWIKEAGANELVVGSQARILYSNCEGRSALALAFNTAVKDGRLSAPIVLSRDHHDVSGTDRFAPYHTICSLPHSSAPYHTSLFPHTAHTARLPPSTTAASSAPTWPSTTS